MRAALYKGVCDVEVVDRPRPHAGPGEAVVRIALCGICGSDVHIYAEGTLPPGIVLGHENVGLIEELGSGVSGFRMGDSVVVSGAGAIGLAAVQLLRLGGTRHITVVEPVREKRDLAMHLGADSAFAPSDLVATAESVGALSGGYGADMAVEAAGAAASTLACGAEEAKVCIDFLETGKLATAGMLSGIIPLENVVVEGLERLRRDRRLVKLAVRP